MDMELKDWFSQRWEEYFPETGLPIVFYYTDESDRGEMVPAPSGHQCLIGVLAKVWKGESLYFGNDSIGCVGGKRYLGFETEVSPNFEYFLSHGIEGRMEGERYKKTPEIVKELTSKAPSFDAPAKYIVFKRWDKLTEKDEPEVVIFMAHPDVLSGLFTLTGFEESEPDGVIAPFGAGCGSIVLYPYMEKDRDRPRGVIGMFDVSARPFVPKDQLSFAVPMKKFTRMVYDMDESFLITRSWERVSKRIKNYGK